MLNSGSDMNASLVYGTWALVLLTLSDKQRAQNPANASKSDTGRQRLLSFPGLLKGNTTGFRFNNVGIAFPVLDGRGPPGEQTMEMNFECTRIFPVALFACAVLSISG
jgi:hypothetical protein